jgi:hypothetical protein
MTVPNVSRAAQPVRAANLQRERNLIRVAAVAAQEIPAAPAADVPSSAPLLLASVGWVVAAIAVFFGLFALSAPELSPAGTLGCAFAAGGIGVLVASLSLRRLPGFKLFLCAILAAYFFRVMTGVVVYQNAYDSNYFDGQGVYRNTGLKGNEFVWTYVNTIRAAESLLTKGEWRPSVIFRDFDDKNGHLHTYMGLFMAAGQSKHALDLAPLNAFHHVLAGILTAVLALACGYQRRTALLSGALIAWIPWLFPASVMLRDSVGLAAVVLGMVVFYLGRQYGFLGSLLMAVPAAFLAWSDRSIYFAAMLLIAVLSVLFDGKNAKMSAAFKIFRFLAVVVLMAACLYYLKHDIGMLAVDKRHAGLVRGENIAVRLATLPLLFLRALAGPFPWFVGIGKYFTPYNLFDYLYHVVQLSIVLMFFAIFRRVLARTNTLVCAAGVFWVMGFIAGGVHTSYLAVAAPFALPPVLEAGASVRKYLAISVVCFLAANVLWITLGLAGSGLVMGVTGY